MTKICCITPDRGDRPELFQFAIKQINRMGMGNSCYLMNEKPKSEMIDLVPRIREGIEMAKRDGFEWAFILENDDFYPQFYMDFVSNFTENSDFIGFSNTWYFNLKNLSYELLEHPGRSSLFCTGFRIDALDRFVWPKDNTAFLDVKLWEYASLCNKRIELFDAPIAIGMKHGLGMCGGKGHRMILKNRDPEMEWLNSQMPYEDFEFYKNLREIL